MFVTTLVLYLSKGFEPIAREDLPRAEDASLLAPAWPFPLPPPGPLPPAPSMRRLNNDPCGTKFTGLNSI